MRQADNKGFWQKIAGIYGAFMKGSDTLYDQIAHRIQSQLTEEMNILELACGTGQLSFRLADQVKLWEATDFSHAMIFEAKKRVGPSQLYFSVKDATDLPYSDETFDAVVIGNALHIMPCPDQSLAQIHRVLKKNGMVFAPTFIHSDGWKAQMRIRLMELAGFHTYYNWNQQEFAAYVQEHGFCVIQEELLGKAAAPLCYLSARKC